MPIFFFTGTPGSGKTYEAVDKIVDNLRKGKNVYTNIDGMQDPVCQENLRLITDLSETDFAKKFHHLGDRKEDLHHFWDFCPEHNSLIVLDEVQNLFSNRDWAQAKNTQFAEWASTHRHHGYDLVIITQNAERVDSAVRALAEWNYVFRKINFVGSLIQSGYLCNVFAGNETTGDPIKRATRRYHKAIFRCYKSYISSDIKEQNVIPGINILKHPVFFLIPVVLGFTIYMLFFKSSLATGDIFGTKKAQASSLKKLQETKKPAFAGFPIPGDYQQKEGTNVEVGTADSGQPQAKPIDQSSSAVAPADQPESNGFIHLTSVEIHNESGLSSYLFMFHGRVYTMANFPFNLIKEDKNFYTDLKPKSS